MDAELQAQATLCYRPLARTMPAYTMQNGRDIVKHRVFTWVRWLAIGLPVAWLARRVDLRLVLAAIPAVGIGGFAAALGAYGATVVAGALRWRWLLHAYGAERTKMPSRTELVHHSMVGLYFALLPSGLVGDFVRARRTEAALPVAADAYVVAALDRISGAIGLLVLAAGSMFASPTYAADAGVTTALRIGASLALAASLGILGVPFMISSHPGLKSGIVRIPGIGRTLAALTPPSRPSGIFAALLLSVFTQSLMVLTLAAIVAPLRPDPPFFDWILALPTIILLTFVPLTPGGIGQREFVFVSFLEPLGITASDATAASLVTMMVTFTNAAIGGALYAWDVYRGRVQSEFSSDAAPPET